MNKRPQNQHSQTKHLQNKHLDRAGARRRQRGMGMVMAIFVITLGAVVTVSVVRSVQDNTDAYSLEILATRALLSAESGAQLAMGLLFPPVGGAADCSAQSFALDAFGLPSCQADTTCTAAAVDEVTVYTIESSGVCTDGGTMQAARTIVASGKGGDIGYGPLQAPNRQLVAAHSSRCLDIVASSAADGALVQQLACSGTLASQRWTTLQHSAGGFQLRAAHSGKCLDAGATPSAGDQLTQEACLADGDPAEDRQLIGLDAQGDGSFVLEHISSGLCIGVLGASTADGAAVVVEACTGADSQRWTPS